MRPCLECREKQQGKWQKFPPTRAPEDGLRLLGFAGRRSRGRGRLHERAHLLIFSLLSFTGSLIHRYKSGNGRDMMKKRENL